MLSALFMQGGALNLDAFVAVQQVTGALPDTVWSMITICGTGVVAFALLSPTLARQPRWYAAGIAAAGIAGLYSNGAKHLFGLPRPAAVIDAGHLHVIGETLRANTFPSGHSVTAFTLAAILVFASRKPLSTAAWVVPVATLIALSRIAVGAHWPADLAAGAAGGWVSGALGVMIVARWRRWNTPTGVRAMGCVSIGIGVSLWIVDLGYPLAAPLQYLAAAVATIAGTAVIVADRGSTRCCADTDDVVTIRTIVLRVVAVAISVGLLWWLLAGARWQGVGARLAALEPGALVGVALLFAASYAMRAARIAGEFRDEIGAGSRRYLRILRLTLVHNALVNLLPFRSGEAAFPVLLSRWFGIGTGRAVVSLLWLRAQDATVMLALAALVWPGLATGWRLCALTLITGGAWAVPAWARRHRLASTSPRLAKIQALLERSTRRNRSGWLWTIGNWSVKLVAETWLVALALAPRDALDPTSAVLGVLGAELAAILPIQGVAGFGTFEAGGAALMRTHGVALSDGLEVVLVLHAFVFALALVAGALAAVLLPGPSKTRTRG